MAFNFCYDLHKEGSKPNAIILYNDFFMHDNKQRVCTMVLL